MYSTGNATQCSVVLYMGKKKKKKSGYMYMLCCAQLLSHVRLFVTPWTVALQAPLFMEFCRQEYWSGLPCSSPGDLANPGIEYKSPALQADSLPAEPQIYVYIQLINFAVQQKLTQHCKKKKTIVQQKFKNKNLSAHAGCGLSISLFVYDYMDVTVGPSRKLRAEKLMFLVLWYWRRLLRVPGTARRSNESILKEISPKYSLQGLTLKLKFQYFGHLM